MNQFADKLVMFGGLTNDPHTVSKFSETVRQVFGAGVAIAMQRGGNLVILAGQTLHDPKHARMAVRNAERAEDRLAHFFPALIRHLEELSGTRPCAN